MRWVLCFGFKRCFRNVDLVASEATHDNLVVLVILSAVRLLPFLNLVMSADISRVHLAKSLSLLVL